MAQKRRGLGRGFDALLSKETPAPNSVEEKASLKQLSVACIQRGRYQPRSVFDESALQELADSIKQQGVVQPVVVRPVGEAEHGGTQYELIAGERRWRAAQMAGLHEVPAVIRDVPDESAIAMSLIENIQRENLNPLEEAVALKRLMDEFGMTHQQVAEAVGRSRAAVSNLLRLLELSLQVKPMVEAGELDMGHARALLPLPVEEQLSVAQKVIAGGLSVRATEALVRKILQGSATEEKAAVSGDPDVERLERDLSDKLGAPVNVRYNAAGKGQLTIKYSSLDELDGILARIR
ncbi:MAG: ParB/RepB/Spo0J family partition protein [Gammaproteobacteria bacterium]|nr:ParB/RepB/Spo0J family partition protein [Gammaproteobacteria bacterium]